MRERTTVRTQRPGANGDRSEGKGGGCGARGLDRGVRHEGGAWGRGHSSVGGWTGCSDGDNMKARMPKLLCVAIRGSRQVYWGGVNGRREGPQSEGSGALLAVSLGIYINFVAEL